MRLPDNSWSPLVFWSLAFLLKILRFVLKRQCLLQCFRNVELIEMPLLSHNRLKEWIENIDKTHDIKKLLSSLSSFNGKKTPQNPTNQKKKYTPLKKHPKPTIKNQHPLTSLDWTVNGMVTPITTAEVLVSFWRSLLPYRWLYKF